MVFCIQAQLLFATAARRDNVRTQIETRIAGRPRWSVDTIVSTDLPNRPNALLVDLRFTIRANQTDLRDRVEAVAIGANAPQPGSWMRVHDCSHDEGTNVCTPTLVTRTW